MCDGRHSQEKQDIHLQRAKWHRHLALCVSILKFGNVSERTTVADLTLVPLIGVFGEAVSSLSSVEEHCLIEDDQAVAHELN